MFVVKTERGHDRGTRSQNVKIVQNRLLGGLENKLQERRLSASGEALRYTTKAVLGPVGAAIALEVAAGN